jgi:hypothetical protein
MNERIENLFKRAGGKISIHNLMSNPIQQREYRELWDENIEKFAKLIILECVEVCNQVYTANYPDAESFERSEEGDAIKQHFGVE